MAELEDAVYAILIADAGVQAVLGTTLTRADGQTGVFPDTMPPKTPLPALTYARVGAQRVSAMGADTGLVWPARIQVTCFASDPTTRSSLATAVRRALKRLAPGTYSGVVIDAVFQAGDGPDMYEGDPLIYERPLDFMVAFTEV